MTERSTNENGDQEKTTVVNNWRDIIKLPVLDKESGWDVQELENILRECIQRITDQNLKDNDGQIYTTLSGGVDSSLCLAIIAELLPSNTPIHTYTVGSSKNHPDILYARIVSDLYNTTHHEIIANCDIEQEAATEFRTFYGDSDTTNRKIEQGDINVWITYREIAKGGAVSVIAHDGIDEQLGGYWLHRKAVSQGKKQLEKIFKDYWQRLSPEHLEPLEQTAHYFGIEILLPYLQEPLVRYISKIPLLHRTSFKSGKLPLKAIARKYFNQEFRLKTIPDRKKLGFISALLRDNI